MCVRSKLFQYTQVHIYNLNVCLLLNIAMHNIHPIKWFALSPISLSNKCIVMFIQCLHNSPHMVSEYMSRICLRNIYDLATHRTIFLVHIDAFFSTGRLYFGKRLPRWKPKVIMMPTLSSLAAPCPIFLGRCHHLVTLKDISKIERHQAPTY